MTASIVEALTKLGEGKFEVIEPNANEVTTDDEPSLASPAVGKPISHGQIIDLWKQNNRGYTLENLLRGARVYVPPPPPKPEPTEEYKALMARLRHEEEERSYERMLTASPGEAAFARAKGASSQARAFQEVNRAAKEDLGEESIDQAEISRQLGLVINFLVSIGGCAAAIWIAAQWWSTTARLFLTLGGSLIVAIAEVAVYSAWSWRMSEGDKKQQKVKEVREVVKTWVIGDEHDAAGTAPVLIRGKDSEYAKAVRRRAATPG